MTAKSIRSGESAIPTLEDYQKRPPHPSRREGGTGVPKAGESGMPLLSIITVVYNGMRDLGRTLDSVAAQDYPRIEQIVVDGGSTDGTLDLVQSRGAGIAKWISEPDGGIYDAMNKGVALATGDWILFINADDWLESPGILTRLVREYLSQDRCDVLVGSTRYFRDGKPLYVGKSIPGLMGRELCINHTSALARRGLFAEHGLYRLDLRLASDNEWFYRVSRNLQAKFQVTDIIISNMSLKGASDRNWILAYRELYRIRSFSGIRPISNVILLLFQLSRMGTRRFLERLGLDAWVRAYRRRFSSITGEP